MVPARALAATGCALAFTFVFASGPESGGDGRWPGIGRRAAAAELAGPAEPGERVQVHGFVSQGLIKTTANNFLVESERGSFEFSEMGINFTAQLTEKLRLGMQLFARDLGTIGNYSAKADWFYLDYRWRDWLGLRAGRVKVPFGLYNDTSDIDAARVPVLLPHSIYPLDSRDFLLAQTGAELYGYVGLGALGAFDYRLFAGTIYLQLTDTPGSPYQVQRFSIPYVAGGRGFWEPPVDGLRVGASAEALKLETTLRAADGSTLAADLSAILWVVSAEYAVHDLLVAAEYSRWHTNTTSSNVQVVPENVSTSERGYVMGNYRFTPWFVPGLYYSLMFPHVSQRSGGPEFVQHDLAATLRFDVNAYWLVKLEGHYMHGTAGLTPALNGNVPRSMLESDWGLFLVKTTAYF